MTATLAIVCLVGLFIVQGALCFVAGVIWAVRQDRKNPPA